MSRLVDRIRAASRRLRHLWSRQSARLRLDTRSSEHWLRATEQYWLHGYKHDPRGPVNDPESYLEFDLETSYTPSLLAAVEQLGGAQSFMEIGCNAGRNLLHLSQRYPDAAMHGFDINAESLALARERISAASHWNLFAGDLTAGALDVFEDGQVDIVFSMGVLVCFPPGAVKQQIISDCLRISRKACIFIEAHSDGKASWNTSPDRRLSPFSIDNYRNYLPATVEILPTNLGPTDSFRVIIVRRSEVE